MAQIFSVIMCMQKAGFQNFYKPEVIFEMEHNKINKMSFVASEHSDQPEHLPSLIWVCFPLIWVFAGCTCDLILSCSGSFLITLNVSILWNTGFIQCLVLSYWHSASLSAFSKVGKAAQNLVVYSYPTSFGQVPVLVIFVLKCLLLKNFNLLLHL